MSDAVLQVRGLRKSYEHRTVVDVETLSLNRGEVMAVLGPNGSGKSTLFRLLLGIEAADGGEIGFAGRTRAGVFQQPFLFSGTARDNIGFGLRGAADRAERIDGIARELGLTSLLDTSVRTLSGGEAQRVALARALVLQADLLLLDEPSASLDVLVRRTFRDDVQRSARAHAGAVLLITHDATEAFMLADRIAVMERGRIVQTGTPAELLENPRSAFVASFTGAELLLDGVVAAVADELVQVDVGGTLIWAVQSHESGWQPERGRRAHVSYRPEDVMISVPDNPLEVSARNQFRLRIAALGGAGGLAQLRLEGALTLSALLTRTSVEALGLAPGKDVIAHMKATALRVLRAE
jgi:molybdopterin-binding protein